MLCPYSIYLSPAFIFPLNLSLKDKVQVPHLTYRRFRGIHEEGPMKEFYINLLIHENAMQNNFVASPIMFPRAILESEASKDVVPLPPSRPLPPPPPPHFPPHPPPFSPPQIYEASASPPKKDNRPWWSKGRRWWWRREDTLTLWVPTMTMHLIWCR